jgi:hypothetical protein
MNAYKTCPRCWEHAALDASVCVCCRHEFATGQRTSAPVPSVPVEEPSKPVENRVRRIGLLERLIRR